MAKIFTIGRQFGSKGWEIGLKLANELNIPFYNEELIELSANKNGMSTEIFAKYDEKPASSLLYSLSLGSVPNELINQNIGKPLNDTIFAAQTEVIKELAEKGPCVIVGRCSNYILKDFNDVINVFIYANIEDRIEYVIKRDGVDRKQAISKIKKTDKTRSSYHNFYSDTKWGETESYDIMIDSSIGVDKAVNILKLLYRWFFSLVFFFNVICW